ncbi:MAG: NADPH-dependent assimilatory sulfite reductase hemoprotein subunit, partial [Leptospiraceae bacterium]|nr:NADPH-dependent assimilatory sulfite reductase hemoprotein subunit [Leptospiraceae bacterium]
MAEEKELSKIEHIKANSNYLRGTILEELNNGTDHFSEENVQILKFHGMYQQKDRDRQKDAEGKDIEKPYTLMLRGRIPGGRL